MKKKFKTIFLMSIFQIVLLISSVAAFSYLAGKTFDIENSAQEENKEIQYLSDDEDDFPETEYGSAIERWLDRRISSFDPQLEIESLMNMQSRRVDIDPTLVSLFCCPKTKNGAICQDLYGGEREKCGTQVYDAKCSQMSDCKIGCCIDKKEGICTPKATKKECIDNNGEWNENENCLINECEKKCCVLGADVAFTTEQRCEYLSLIKGFKKDFRNIGTEYECLAVRENQPEGACVFEGGNCRFLIESECLRMNGRFYRDYLCSHTSLETECEKQKYTGCVDGKDEIYWFDSCGNRENIYSSNKILSWNNGMILDKSESCNPTLSNADSTTCGNCNLVLGSICSSSSDKKIIDGNFICKDLNCVDENGKKWKNGESWCVYDAYVGDGKDTVGSRHWKMSCVNGEIKSEGCADYRAGICVQSAVESQGELFSISSILAERKFYNAECIANEAFICIDKEEPEDCEKNSQCLLKRIRIDEGFKFDVCVGHYPRGFDLSLNSSRKEMQEKICGAVNTECIVVYQKNFIGKWKCEHNCNCVKPVFTKTMNDLCIALGDCGSYINYIGEATYNIKVKNTKDPFKDDSRKISLEKVKTEYQRYKNIRPGYFIYPPKLRETLEKYYGYNISNYEESVAGQKAMEKLGTIMGATGTLALAGAWALTPTAAGIPAAIQSVTFPNLIHGGVTVAFPISSALSSFSAVAAGAAIGMFVGKMLASAFGISGGGATALMVGGALAGGGISAMIMGIGGAFGPLGLGLGAALMAWTLIMGWGQTKEVKVKFECLPWQPPEGVSNEVCEKCHENPLKLCTEYRCNSLGRNCKIINENSDFPKCISIEPHRNPLRIFPNEVSQGFKFLSPQNERVQIRTSSNECIPEFTPVVFSLNTSEYAKCAYDYVNEPDMEKMLGSFAEANYHTIKHTALFYMPSIDSLERANVTGDIRARFANINLYVKCEDIHKNKNPRNYQVNLCVKSGPDITPAVIIDSYPKDNSYLKFGEESLQFSVYLNEPAECKWSHENKAYGLMENSMTCITDVFQMRMDGWPCSTTLTGLNKDENKIYIKCKDQPWLSEEENEKRNINTNPFVFTFKKTKEQLEIVSLSPDEDIKKGSFPFEIEMQVETKAGVNNGNSICSFGHDKNKIDIEFLETGGKIHKQVRNMFLEGNYRVFVRCVDVAGNTAEGEINFNVEIDVKPPEIVRIYNLENQLIVITNEEARCYYSTERCNFNLEEGEKMTTAYSEKHTTNWETGKIYYIKCEDIWGNTNADCAIQAAAEIN